MNIQMQSKNNQSAFQSQSTKQLLVIGDVQTVQFFTLIGAIGFVLNADSSHHLQPVLQHIRDNAKKIGGILVSTDIVDELIERIDRMKTVEIPILRLPNKNGASQIGFLEALMEKAVGMKMEKKHIV